VIQHPHPDQDVSDARRYQQAFDLYFLGLTFTVLALSIQTASFGEYASLDSLELLAWLLLLLSGLSGIHRGLWKPNLFNCFSMKPELDKQIQNARSQHHDAQEAGLEREQVQNLFRKMKEAEKIGKMTHQVIEDLVKKEETSLIIQKYCFMAGIITLVIARAYLPIVGIVKAVKALS